MINTDSVFSHLLFATIRIEAIRTNGKKHRGTAFFLEYGANTMTALITNKHVIKDTVSITFFVHEADSFNNPTGRSFPITLNDRENHWINHPNPNIDLCAMRCEPLIKRVNAEGHKMYFRRLGDKKVPTQETLEGLLPIEDVIMVGYPIGLWDKLNNFPLFRKGITSSHPAVDFDGKSIGIVDIAALPGSSGSPIVIANTSPYFSGTKIVAEPRFILLGILYAYQPFPVDGEIIDVPTEAEYKAISDIPAHLGFYIKSRELLTLKKEFKEFR